MLTTFEQFYMAAWLLASGAGLLVAWMRRAQLRVATRAYWRFLLQPWKLVLFAIALVGLTLMAPYTGDPTWDYIDASLMAVLTFAWAPWAVGALGRVHRDTGAAEIYVALVASLFAFSWVYDGYIVVRDGVYPPTWASNLVISAVIYIAAGLFWSLEVHPERGVIFAFMDDAWPELQPGAPGRLIGWMLVFVVPVAVVFLYFLWDQYAP